MRTLLFLTFFLSISACSHRIPHWKQEILATLTPQQQYFCEVALGSEFGRKYHKIRKWQQPIRIFLTGEEHSGLEIELDHILEELNQLIPTMGLIRVFSEEEANIIVFLGTGKAFAQRIKQAKGKIAENWGLVFVKHNWRGEMEYGELYVDIYRTLHPDAQKHLLREELTQALGLLNDSFQYEKSIFYQPWTMTTQYTPLDRWLIHQLYQEDIFPGMKFKAVINVLKNNSAELD